MPHTLLSLIVYCKVFTTLTQKGFGELLPYSTQHVAQNFPPSDPMLSTWCAHCKHVENARCQVMNRPLSTLIRFLCDAFLLDLEIKV